VTPEGNEALKGLPSLRELVTTTLSPVVVGVPNVTATSQFAPAFAVTLAGQEIVTAEPDETTAIKKSQLAPSELVIVTGVVPIGKNEPEAALAVIVPQVPDVVAANVTCVPLVGVGGVLGSPSASKFSTVSAVAVIFPAHVNVQVGGVGLDPVALVSEVLLAFRLSVVPLVTVAVVVRSVPLAMLEFTLYVIVKVADSSITIEDFVHVVAPAASTAGVVQVKPVACASVWKVVLAGDTSEKLTFCAVSGPALKTPI